MLIPDPDFDFYPSRIPYPGQKGTESRIRNTGLFGSVVEPEVYP
jgi:hypothetical protein